MRPLLPLLALAAAALAGCVKHIEAPGDRGVCWSMTQKTKTTADFHKVAVNIDTVEKCAVELESMRTHFLGLGGTNETIVGAYQGQFLFLLPEGIFMGQTLNGGRYLLLVRSGDGRLVKPGVLPVDQ